VFSQPNLVINVGGDPGLPALLFLSQSDHGAIVAGLKLPMLAALDFAKSCGNILLAHN